MFNVINKFVNNNVGLSKSFLTASVSRAMVYLLSRYMVDEYMVSNLMHVFFLLARTVLF